MKIPIILAIKTIGIISVAAIFSLESNEMTNSDEITVQDDAILQNLPLEFMKQLRLEQFIEIQ